MRVAPVVAALYLLVAAQAAAQSSGAAATSDLARAIQRKDWPRAVQLATAESAAQPQSARAAYNLACVQALAGQKDAAVAALGRAADLGFGFTATMLRDYDLDSIRDHPAFPEVVAQIKANNLRALEKFEVTAENAKVLVFKPAKGDPRKPAPLIVALHGRGGTADEFAPVWRGWRRTSARYWRCPRA